MAAEPLSVHVRLGPAPAAVGAIVSLPTLLVHTTLRLHAGTDIVDVMARHELVRRCLARIVNVGTHEWLLTALKWANGGDTILLRSILLSTQVYLAVIGLKNAIDPTRSWVVTLDSAVTELFATVQWFAPIFAAAYASLYARYSSQWNYLAGVYNRIKETEARGSTNAEALAEWKAGFIEDAEDLHLASKSMFRSTIVAWAQVRDVEAKFKAHTANGKVRWAELMDRLEPNPDANTDGAPGDRPLSESADSEPAGASRSDHPTVAVHAESEDPTPNVDGAPTAESANKLPPVPDRDNKAPDETNDTAPADPPASDSPTPPSQTTNETPGKNGTTE